MNCIRWSFTNRHSGETVEVNGPRNRKERDNLKTALRLFAKGRWV